MSVLSRQSIRALCEAENGLVDIATCHDFETQLQPNGIDLTVANVEMIGGASMGSGQLGVSDDSRRIPAYEHMEPARDGYWVLYGNQSYVVTTNEVVTLPTDIMALVKPRSSLIRMGGYLNTAVWDAGFHGHSKFVLSIAPGTYSLRLQKNARFAQMVFLTLDASTERGYDGVYQERKPDAGFQSQFTLDKANDGADLGVDYARRRHWVEELNKRQGHAEMPPYCDPLFGIRFDRQIGIIPEQAGHEIWQLMVSAPISNNEAPRQFDRVNYHAAGQALATKRTEAGRRTIGLTNDSITAFLRRSGGEDVQWEVRDLQPIEGDEYRMRILIERLEDEDPAVAQNHRRTRRSGGEIVERFQLQLSHWNLGAIPEGTVLRYRDASQTLESDIEAEGEENRYHLYLRLADAAVEFLRGLVVEGAKVPVDLTLAENYEHAVLVEAK